MTDTNGARVLYDGNCEFCTRWARRGQRWLANKGYRFEPLPAPSDEVQIVTTTGRAIGGADAVMALARHIWWAWPLWTMSRLPGILPIMRAAYRRMARRRHCRVSVGLRTLTRRWEG